jgi:hypothetical protein
MPPIIASFREHIRSIEVKRPDSLEARNENAQERKRRCEGLTSKNKSISLVLMTLVDTDPQMLVILFSISRQGADTKRYTNAR